MAGNKKPRKRRSVAPVPKADRPLPIVFAVAPELKRRLDTGAHSSLDALRLGAGVADDAHTVMHAALLALELRRHMKPDQTTDDVIADGLAAIRRVYARHEKTGKWGFTGDEFASLKEVLTLSDAMQGLCSRREMRDAAAAVAIKTKGIV